MKLVTQLTQGSVPAGSHAVDHLYATKRENFPSHYLDTEHTVVDINLQRIITNEMGDKGIKSVSIADTEFWYIDTTPASQIDKATREEFFVKNFLPDEHLFPSAEYLLGVLMAIIEKQPDQFSKGPLARENRFYFKHERGHAGELDVRAMTGKWYLSGGHACFYNRVYMRSTRIFSSAPRN